MLPLFTLLGATLYSYPLLVGMGWALSFIVSKKLNQIQKEKIPSFNTLFIFLFCTSFIGAKLVFLFTNNEYKNLLTSSSFWLGGGFVFYGGALFALVTLAVHKWITGTKINSYNAFIPAICLGHAVGRIGCLLAGCCFGTKSQIFWNIYLHGAHRHPTQAYESFVLFILGIIFYRLFSRGNEQLILKYLIAYSTWRFFVEFLRGDLIRGIYFELSFSQYVSIMVFISSTVTLLVKARVLRRE